MASASNPSTGPFDLSVTPIHVGTKGGVEAPVVPLAGFAFDGPAFEAYIAEHCRPGEPGRLIMVETTPTDWPSWECHTQGDEIVIILEGRGSFLQQIDGSERRTPYAAGVAIVNPKGVWHTADVSESTRAIYITPCPGTEHKPR